MSKYIEVSAEWLREVIKGRIQFRKCPLCDPDAIEIQAYGADGEPCASDQPDATRYNCENCDEIGFIELPIMEGGLNEC